MLARCGKILPKLQVPCNRPAGHTGWCSKIDRVKQAAYEAAWDAANPGRKQATHAAWDAANPGRKDATTAAWYAAHPGLRATQEQKRRAALAGATTEPFTQVELKARMASFGDACYYCALIGEVGPYECEDHVFPIEPRRGHRRGPHALRNLVPSCTTHNSQKHNKQPIDFINKLLDKHEKKG